VPIGDVIQKDEDRATLVSHLQTEIDTSEKEREEYIQRVDKWRRQREAKPKTKTKNFPWEGASNVTLPQAAIATDTVKSALQAKFNNKKPFYHVGALKQDFYKHAEAVEKFLSFLVESKFHINLREVNNEIFYDTVSIGTEFVTVPWVNDLYRFKRKGLNGGMEEATQTRHKGPMVVPVQVEDFFARSYSYDIQNMEFCAIRHRLLWHELKQREQQGIYENVDEIETEGVKTQLDEWDQKEKERTGIDPKEAKLYDIMECYIFWDVDGDGIPEDIKIWFERSTGTVLREEYNDLGVRPIRRLAYISLPKQLYGIGIGAMSEDIQEAGDALFNMAVNSTHISSLQMFTSKRGSPIGEKEEFYPFKKITVDDPMTDFNPIGFPNTSGPNMQMLQYISSVLDRRTGANNPMMGQPDAYAKSRATASGTMFLAQQGNKLFDAAASNLEEDYGQIGLLILFQLIRHKDELDDELAKFDPETQALLREVFNMNVEDIHLNFNFTIMSSDAEQTEEAKRQRILTLSQLYNMYGQQVLGLLKGDIMMFMQINPEMAQGLIQRYLEFDNQFLVGTTKLMGEVLDFMSIDHDGYLPYTKDIEKMIEMMNAMKDAQLGGMIGQQNQQSSGSLPAPSGGNPGLGGPSNGNNVGGTQEGGGTAGGPGQGGAPIQPGPGGIA